MCTFLILRLRLANATPFINPVWLKHCYKIIDEKHRRKTTTCPNTGDTLIFETRCEQFAELVNAIGTGEYEYVVVWEITRLVRLGSICQRFFEECEQAGTTVAVIDGWTDKIHPDGTGKLIADISAAVAEEERRRLIKRTQAGVERAQREGKWLGAVPKGFARDGEGYLQLVLDRPRRRRGWLPGNAERPRTREALTAAREVAELKERHDFPETEFLVDGMGYLTALVQTDLDGHLDYVTRNLIEKWFQTLTMRVDRFYNAWMGGRASVQCWLAAFAFYYNYQRPNQALDNRTPVEEVAND